VHRDLGRGFRRKKVPARDSIELESGVEDERDELEVEVAFERETGGEFEGEDARTSCFVTARKADLVGCRTASAPAPSAYSCVVLQFLSSVIEVAGIYGRGKGQGGGPMVWKILRDVEVLL